MRSKWIWIPFGIVMLTLVGAILCCTFFAYYATRDSRPRTLYCWLLFGSEPKARILVRCDGAAISIDANGNGRFEPNERFARVEDCKSLEIVSPSKGATYTITNIGYRRMNAPPWARVSFYVDIGGAREYRELGEAEMSTTQGDAVEVPFDGHLVVRAPYEEYFRLSSKPRDPLRIQKGGQPSMLQVDVGTFNARSGAAVCPNRGRTSAFPPGVHPVADIQFPPKRHGDPPVRKQYPLDGFC